MVSPLCTGPNTRHSAPSRSTQWDAFSSFLMGIVDLTTQLQLKNTSYLSMCFRMDPSSTKTAISTTQAFGE